MDLNSDDLSWPVCRLYQTLSDLLCYLDVPNAETTARPEWLDKALDEITHDFQAVISAITDRREWDRLSRLRVNATHFANVLHANPGIRLAQWTQDFPDCMPQLRAFTRELKECMADKPAKRTPTEAVEFDSDFTEALPKEFVANQFKKSVDWLREQIDAGAIRVHSETKRTARNARFHIDTVPMLKHAHDRARLLEQFRAKKTKSRPKAD